MLGKCVNNGWIGKGIGSHHSLRGVSILCGGGFIPHNLGMENQHLEGGEAVAGILIQPGEPRGAQIDGELILRINSGTNIIMVVGGTTEGETNVHHAEAVDFPYPAFLEDMEWLRGSKASLD